MTPGAISGAPDSLGDVSGSPDPRVVRRTPRGARA